MTDISTLEQNKKVAAAFLAAVSAADWDRMLGLMDESFTWWLAGSLPFSGTYGKQETLELLRDQLAPACKVQPVYTPFAFTAEGGRVAVETEAHGEMANGRIYDNVYHSLFEIRDGLIVRFREYLDTMHVHECFSADPA
jgi:uncharacterized protein